MRAHLRSCAALHSWLHFGRGPTSFSGRLSIRSDLGAPKPIRAGGKTTRCWLTLRTGQAHPRTSCWALRTPAGHRWARIPHDLQDRASPMWKVS